MSCHNAQEGQVLGAISLTFDIQEDRISNIILINVVATISIFLILILIYLRKR